MYVRDFLLSLFFMFALGILKSLNVVVFSFSLSSSFFCLFVASLNVYTLRYAVGKQKNSLKKDLRCYRFEKKKATKTNKKSIDY